MVRLIILFLLLSFSSFGQTVQEAFSGYGDIQTITGSGPTYTITINPFIGNPKFQPNGQYNGTEVSVGNVIWADCSRYVIASIVSTSYASMTVTATVPATDWALGITPPNPNQRVAILTEIDGVPILPPTADGNGGALSSIDNVLYACILAHQTKQLLIGKNSVNEITDYVGITDVPPSSPASSYTGETWRNSVGELYYSNGTQWLSDKEVKLTNTSLQGQSTGRYKIGIDTLGKDTMYLANNGVFRRFEAGGSNISFQLTTPPLGNLEITDGGGTLLVPILDIAPIQSITGSNEISVSPSPGGILSLDMPSQGASTNSILRWDGSGWKPFKFVPKYPLLGTGIVGDSIRLDNGTTINDVLMWDGSDWIPTQPILITDYPLLGSGTTLDPFKIDDGFTAGDLLIWDGADWTPQYLTTDNTLAGNGWLSTPLKLAQQGATSGQVLKWNGTTWLPSTDLGTTYTGGTGINVTGTVITNTGDLSPTNELQTLANTSDATSHTATLSNSGGSLKLVEGSNISLTTTGTGLDAIVTIAGSAAGITTLNGLSPTTQTFATGTTGTDFNISSATSTHTFNLPVASATNTGKLSSTDWTTFNNKVTNAGTGVANQWAYWTGANTLSTSNLLTRDASGYLSAQNAAAFGLPRRTTVDNNAGYIYIRTDLGNTPYYAFGGSGGTKPILTGGSYWSLYGGSYSASNQLIPELNSVMWGLNGTRWTRTTSGSTGPGGTFVATYTLNPQALNTPAYGGITYPAGKMLFSYYYNRVPQSISVRCKNAAGTWFGPYSVDLTKTLNTNTNGLTLYPVYSYEMSAVTNYLDVIEITTVGHAANGIIFGPNQGFDYVLNDAADLKTSYSWFNKNSPEYLSNTVQGFDGTATTPWKISNNSLATYFNNSGSTNFLAAGTTGFTNAAMSIRNGGADNNAYYGLNVRTIANNPVLATNGFGQTLMGTESPSSLYTRTVINGLGSTSSTYGLQVHNSTGTNNAFVVRDDGNVGIGTSAPTARLTVKDNNTSASYIAEVHADDQSPWLAGWFNDTYSTTSPVFTYFGRNDGSWEMGTNAGKTWTLFQGYGTSRMVMLSSGDMRVEKKLGVGGVNPSTVLHAYGTNGTVDGLTLDCDAATPTAVILKSNGSLKGYAPAIAISASNFAAGSSVGDMVFRSEANKILFSKGTALSMAIDGSNVGIGIVSPTASMHVKAGTASASTAPFKFTVTGSVLNTTPEVGAFEVDAANRAYYTGASGTRNTLAYLSDVTTVTMKEESFTATAAQTTFTIAYSAPAPSGTSMPIRVYRNGVRLKYVASGPTSTQFTYTTTTVTTTANAAGDVITIEYLN